LYIKLEINQGYTTMQVNQSSSLNSSVHQSPEDANVVSRSTYDSYCQSGWPRLLTCLI